MIDGPLNVLEAVNPRRQNRGKKKVGRKERKIFKKREKYNDSKQCTRVKASINANHG